MLDEPTNHLDIESLTWLEEYLKGYDGSVVVISHDRRFLDNLTRRTIEIANGKASEYKGNYSYYLKEREIRLEMLRASYENQQEAIRATMAFVDRFRYQATKARQVQSRLKQLDKIERIEMDDEQGSISFDFPPPPSPGRILMKLEGVTKAYGPRAGLHGPRPDARARRPHRVSRLQRRRQVDARADHRRPRADPGRDAHAGPQRHHLLLRAAPGRRPRPEEDRARDARGRRAGRPAAGAAPAARLLPVHRRRRLQARRACSPAARRAGWRWPRCCSCPANLLILDEPTNHLDVKSKGVLQEALRRFAGAYCIVSHDRDFLEPLATKVAEFRDGRVSLFLGGVTDWLEKQRREREAARPRREEAAEGRPRRRPAAPARAAAAKPGRRRRARRPAGSRGAGRGRGRRRPPPHDKDRKRREAERRQERARRLRPLQTALEKLEKKIAEQEARKKQIEASLGDPAVCQSPERVSALSVEYRELTTNLAYSYDEWAKLEGEIEKADRETAG